MKIPFAIAADGRVVEARQLDEDAPGPFLCAACRSLVTLRQGAHRVWHFAHRAGSDCTTGFESALHLLAKQILVEARHLQTPDLRCQLSPFGRTVTLRHAETRRWEGPGEVEKWLEGFRPDVVLPGRTPLIVEVAVTHFCDDEKRRKLSELGIPALEINLSGIARNITEKTLKELVLESVASKSWIYHDGVAETLALLKAEQDAEDVRSQQAEDEARARKVSLDAERPDEESRNEHELQEREMARWLKVRQADKSFRESSDEHKLAYLADRLCIYEAWPEQLDVDVRWASTIGVPRRIWQGDLFRRHILGKDAPTEVSVDTCADWLARRYVLETGSANLVRVAVWDFFCSLESNGYLVRKVRQRFNIRREALQRFIPSRPPLLFWVRTIASQKRFLEAAAASGIQATDSQLRELHAELSTARTQLSEDAYLRSMATRLHISLDTAASFLVRAGVLAGFGQSA